MDWVDKQSFIKIYPPKEFNFKECLIFLGRDEQEILHQIEDDRLYKVIKLKQTIILFKVMAEDDYLKVEFINSLPPKNIREEVATFIWDWFDLDTNLDEFYELVNDDKILQNLIKKHNGLRMIGIYDLFETIVWAILGQQINLNFAYTLKKRFVEKYGESIIFAGQPFWIFPSYNEIAPLHVKDLRELQITNRKSEYIIGIAQAMQKGELSKELLMELRDDDQVKKLLMQYRGIGAWSADYIMMKCLHFKNSFPIADVGLQNALKYQLHIDRKPTAEEMKELATKWEGWKAYATFYLWRSLYD